MIPNVMHGKFGLGKASDHEYILLPLMLSNSLLSSSSQSIDNKDADEVPGKGNDDLSERNGQKRKRELQIKKMTSMSTGLFDDAYDDREEVGAEADLNNLETTMNVSSIPITRIHKDHIIEQIIRYLHSAPLTRRMSQQNIDELGLVWTLVDLPKGKRAIGTKWVYRNKKYEKGIVVRNKVRLVAKGYTQEEGIDYDKVFDPVTKIEAISKMIPDEFSNMESSLLLRIRRYNKGGWNLQLPSIRGYLRVDERECIIRKKWSSRPIHLVTDGTVYKEWEDKMERAANAASTLEAEQDSGNINRTQSMATLNESLP
ncbi:retrovirus-related pol polyprotein from transposon TNT 1-94 [Tanacetum coccineum]